MNSTFADARIEEIKFLSEIDRQGSMSVKFEQGPKRDMVVFLIRHRFLNDLYLSAWTHDRSEGFSGLPNESLLERNLNAAHLESLSRALGGEEVSLQLTHSGRVRLSELKEAVRVGKMREKYGILWDGRYLESDLQLAILDASETAPLSVGYLDMNGLKGVNDKFGGHDAGSVAVRAYFLNIATAIHNEGDAYAPMGDEVIALLPSKGSNEAKDTLTKACQLLEKEQLNFEGRPFPHLSIAVGVATTTDPKTYFKQLHRRAETQMYRAKEKAHERSPNPSVIAVEGEELIVIS